MRELLCANRRLTVREISAEAGIPYSACQVFLTEFLNMRCVSAKFAPRVLPHHRVKGTPSVANDRNKRQKPIRTSRKALSQVTRLRLRIWSENETSIRVMEVARVPRTVESASDAFQSESHDFFFLHGGDCSLRIRPRRSNSESTLICWGSEAAETHLLSLEAKETVILCITTMHSRTRLTLFRFLDQIMTVLRVTSHPTPWRGWLLAVYQF